MRKLQMVRSRRTHTGAHTRLGSARWGWGINTGVTVYRKHSETESFLRAWRDMMQDPTTLTRQLDDQGSFMDVLAGRAPAVTRGNGTFARDSADERVLLAGLSGQLKITVLPTILFPGGKTLFDYHLPEKHGTQPYAVHGTFQRYNNAGKRARFREIGATLAPRVGALARSTPARSS